MSELGDSLKILIFLNLMTGKENQAKIAILTLGRIDWAGV